MTSSAVVYKGSGQGQIEKTMETEKYVTLVSRTDNNNNFTVVFSSSLTFAEGWAVAVTKASIPHGHSHFAETFKSLFPNNPVIAGLNIYYSNYSLGTSLDYIQKNVHVNDIVDGLGDGVSKADVFK